MVYSIIGTAAISAMGLQEDWNDYQSKEHFLSLHEIDEAPVWLGKIPTSLEQEIANLQANRSYKRLDRTALLALYTGRQLSKKVDFAAFSNVGINLGSSRGATASFEQHHTDYLTLGHTSPTSSPTTTLGNIASWVAHDLQLQGPSISHSITCSTGLHAVLNGLAWLQAGFNDMFIVGATESPLTPFTVAQMRALKISSNRLKASYPCQALDLTKGANTMVLGEGAALMSLVAGEHPQAKAYIKGFGHATEPLTHGTSISADGVAFQKAMTMAIKDIDPTEIDAIVMHAPGTIKGDKAEQYAIQTVFGSHQPSLTTNKWKIGHTFATSGLLSLFLAIEMLEQQAFAPVPYIASHAPAQFNKILVNAVGFGGNAVSILVSK